jgi:hypothetical protein
LANVAVGARDFDFEPVLVAQYARVPVAVLLARIACHRVGPVARVTDTPPARRTGLEPPLTIDTRVYASWIRTQRVLAVAGFIQRPEAVGAIGAEDTVSVATAALDDLAVLRAEQQVPFDAQRLEAVGVALGNGRRRVSWSTCARVGSLTSAAEFEAATAEDDEAQGATRCVLSGHRRAVAGRLADS